MQIYELTKGIKNCQIFGDDKLEISSLTFDSRNATPGSMFFCIDGTKVSGKIFACDAIKNGAVCVVTNKHLDACVTQIVVQNIRKAMAKISANFYQNPQKSLKIVGITGTNGKTSTSYILAQMLERFGKKVGVIGTSGIFVDGQKYPSKLTTPDSIMLFQIFKKMQDCGIEICIMEVSAHAIFLQKIYGIKFFAKILTNVTSDHLDFFDTQKKYQDTKKKFFESGKNFVLCGDDKIGKFLKNRHKTKSVTFGFEKSNDCVISARGMTLFGSGFFVTMGRQKLYFQTNMVGKFNIYNFVASLLVLQKFGFEIEKLAKKQQNFQILGRFDVKKFKNCNVIIDYAHTASSLQTLFKTIKSVSGGKNIVVIGAPGERETKKRFLFGKIAGKYCQSVIATTDNPASENPRRIMFEILCGAKQTNANLFAIEDRKKAIQKAFEIAPKNSNILIVGKGSETSQIVGDRHIAYCDYDVVDKITKNKKFQK